MDRNDSMDNARSGNQGGEDNSEAVAHVHNAQANRDALADENRRVEATAGNSANQPIGGQNGGGSSGASASGSGTTTQGASEDTSQARANTQNAADNRDALAEENRRVQASAPESTQRPIGDANNS